MLNTTNMEGKKILATLSTTLAGGLFLKKFVYNQKKKVV